MTDHVAVTLTREDWERLVRLADRAAEVSAQSAEDAHDYDPEEGPDTAWIVSRQDHADDARAFAARLRASAPGTD